MKYKEKTLLLDNHVEISPNKIIGKGHSFCHHGELLQGVFYCENLQEYVYGLTTLKCNLFSSRAMFIPNNTGKINITPTVNKKSKKAAELMIKYLNKNVGGDIFIQSNIIPKLGFGSSTADILSTMLAISDLYEVELTEDVLAKLAVKSEIASDSIMYQNDILFAQKKGVVIEEFKKKLPTMIVLGFDEAPENNGFDTVSMKPLQYSTQEKAEFQKLRLLLSEAAEKQDVNLLGEVATRSALVNQKYYPKKNLEKIIQIKDEKKASGVQISHSGDLVGLIWDPTTPFLHERIEESKQKLKNINIKSFWIFET
ncbi:Threonine kinase in B12 biosynthesis [Tenacibaculum sp. 190524A02b]|uniref:L-threonine kinase n=1 Tax=Tenacibaculum vairaonense TaxID=3137860 RepID=A0ABM9PQM0_9FLAO